MASRARTVGAPGRAAAGAGKRARKAPSAGRPHLCRCDGDCRTLDGKRRRTVCWCSPGKPCECACCKGKPPLPPGVAPRPEGPPIKISAKELRDEIKRQTGVEYSLSHSYALLASFRRRKPR